MTVFPVTLIPRAATRADFSACGAEHRQKALDLAHQATANQLLRGVRIGIGTTAARHLYFAGA
jgi:hypothetical protein